ncbi:hypothetical protein DsansV1_C30g0214141 [Dioscorea sansibarensis]
MESETLALDLDENGFPIDSLSSEEEPVDRDSEKVKERGLVIPSAAQSASSFALDFYAGGTDWSCLISKDKCKGNKGLVQKNLFQAWGMENPLIRPRSSISFSPPRKRHCLKRIADDRSGPERPRICPFYKKIPGASFSGALMTVWIFSFLFLSLIFGNLVRSFCFIESHEEWYLNYRVATGCLYYCESKFQLLWPLFYYELEIVVSSVCSLIHLR